jgi:hypothetical protein
MQPYQKIPGQMALRGEFVSLTLIMIILAGMILASIVMLSLNHYFYMRRRLTDLRLESINEVNWLLAQFLTNCITDRDYVPSEDFLHAFRAATSKTWALFSHATCRIFKQVEAMVEPNLGAPPGGKRDVDAFLQAQDAALRALYRETGLRVPRSLPSRSTAILSSSEHSTSESVSDSSQ